MALILGFALSATAAAATRDEGQTKGNTGGTPGFSGTWIVNAEKSDPAAGRGGGGGRGGAAPVTIEQTPSEFKIETGQQKRVVKLDGSESINEITTRGGPVRMRLKARWEGTNLVIDTVNEATGVTSKEVRSLSPDGKEMTVQTTAETPQGSLTRKTVYTKGS
jgi:hypothetical protein